MRPEVGRHEQAFKKLPSLRLQMRPPLARELVVCSIDELRVEGDRTLGQRCVLGNRTKSVSAPFERERQARRHLGAAPAALAVARCEALSELVELPLAAFLLEPIELLGRDLRVLDLKVWIGL